MVSRVSRAKQFLPFDALKGFQEALREKEKEYEERKELSEESLKELDNIFNRIEIGSNIKIMYYNQGKYDELKGIVTKIDCVKRKILIDEIKNVNILDIISIIH